MGAGEDFNPGFSFDLGQLEGPAQTPWEFGGALKMAVKDNRNSSTIDDKINKRLQERHGKQQQGSKQQQGHKQQQNGKQQQGDKQQQGKQQQKAAAAVSRKRQREANEQSDDDSEADDSSNEDSEAESDLDDESSGGRGSSESDQDDVMDDESSGGGDDSDDEAPLPGELDADSDDDIMDDDDDESSDDEQPATAKGKQQQQQQNGRQKPQSAAAAAAAARKAAMANGHTDAGAASDSEAGSEEEAAAAAPPAGKQKQQQKQQKQQQRQDAAGSKHGGGKAGFYAETQRGFKQDERTFQDLNLSRPLLRAVTALGYTQPTPIQAACIPLALAGRDICGSAVTGSGKTAAFTLPILERLLYRPRQVAATYVLILSPTRELAAQIHSMIQKLAQFTDIDAALIVGGLSLQAQSAALRTGPAIVVATPGRIIDHVRNSQGFGLEDLAVLVLDEADRLLEMGFKEELRELLRLAPRNRQTMLFSATFSEDVQRLASLSLKSPVRLAADPIAAAPETLSQEVVRLKGVSGNAKEAVLLALASRSFSGGKTIIFCETKQRAHRLKILFGLCELPPAAELHGDMTQAARLQSLEKFRKGEVAFLLATDVAARGLDILGLQVVLNFDAPRNLETYLHRVGRTARAGSEGLAVSLITDDDRSLLKSVVKTGRVQLKERLVPHQAIKQWQAKAESVEPDVQRVMAEEREETALRKAEMEANKAHNMLAHEDEIYSRPARTWFQTEKEKKSAAAAAAAAAAQGKTVMEMEAAAAAAGGKAAKAAAKSAAKQDKRNAKLKEQRAAEAAAGTKRKASELQTETEQFNKAIRGVKSRARALMQQGMSAKVAQKMAQTAVTGVSTSHQKKKRKTSGAAAAAADGGGGDAAGDDMQGGLFSGDGTGKGSGSGAGGGSKGRSSSGGSSAKGKSLSKTDLNKLKRGGKGKSSFKSKKKFKRR